MNLAEISELRAVRLRDEWISHELSIPYYEGTSFERLGLHQWCMTSLFQGCGALARQISTTDADGRFTMNLPVGTKCVALSKASRMITGGKTEYYYWIHEVSTDISGDIMLSSPNMVDSSAFDALLRECGADLRVLPKGVVERKLGQPDLSWCFKWREAQHELSTIERNEKQLRSMLEYEQSTLRKLNDSQ